MPPLYSLAKAGIAPVLRWGWRPVVEGLSHVPSAGGAILAANHLAVADQVFLGAIVRRHVAYWAKAEYFRGAGLRGGLVRGIVLGLGAIPVDRGGGPASGSAFDAAVPVLEAGGLVAVFPEGTRSPDGRLYRGHTGVVRLARKAGVPVVPVGLTGTGDVRPLDLAAPRRGEVAIRFGPPIDVAGGDGTAEEVRATTDALMAAIQALSGQAYVPQYAPKRAA